MRRTAGWILLLAALVAAIWLGTRPSDKPDRSLTSDAPPESLAPGDLTALEVDRAAAQPTLGVFARPEGDTAALCTLIGRVLGDGRLTEATVRFGRLPDDPHVAFSPDGESHSFIPPHLLEPLRLASAAESLHAADGRFRIEGLKAGRYRLLAEAQDGQTGYAVLEIPPHAVYAELDLDLYGGGQTLEGRAVYADGRPFEGWIEAGASHGFAYGESWGRYGRANRVDAAGRFSLRGLPAGDVVISAVASGAFRYLDAALRVPTAGEYLLTVRDGPNVLRGRVIDAQSRRGLGDVALTAWSSDHSGRKLAKRVLTTADGAFQVGLLAEVYRCAFEAKGYSIRVINNEYALREGLEVTLEKEARLRGRVTVQGIDEPAGGAVVRAHWAGNGNVSSRMAVADAKGRYVLEGVAPGMVFVIVGEGPWCTPDLQDLYPKSPWLTDVAPGADVAKDLVVVPAAVVSGRVVDAKGRPVAGAQVAAESMLAAHASTDREGRFLLRGIPPQLGWWLNVSAPGYKPHAEERTELSSGEALDIDVKLVARRRLTVQVLDAEDGTPVVNATVLVSDARDQDDPTAMTDEHGRCELWDVEEGSLEIFLEAETHLSPGKWLSVEGSGGPARRLTATVRLVAGTTLRIQVVDEEGAPVPGSHLTLRPEGMTYEQRWRRLKAYTDAKGQILLQGLERVAYKLDFSLPPEFIAAPEQDVPAGTHTLRVEVRRGATFSVRVEDESGAPVAGASLVLGKRGGGRAKTSASDSEGVIYLQGIDPDLSYTASLEPPDGVALVLERLWGWKPTSRTFTMARAYEIHGRVIDDAGHGIEGAGVIYNPASSKVGATSVETEEDGYFRLRGLPKGKVLIRARITPADPGPFIGLTGWPHLYEEGLIKRSKEIQVVEAGARDVVFEVAGGADLKLRVENWMDLISFRAHVVLDGGSVQSRSNPSVDQDGAITVRGLENTRTYTLWIGNLQGGRYVLETGLRPGQNVTLKAKQGGAVSGRLLAPPGVDLKKCSVFWFGPHNYANPGEIDLANGTFRIEGLPEGFFLLGANFRDGETKLTARARVSAGDRVDLELKPE